MTVTAISFVAGNLYVSLMSSVELAISSVVMSLRQRQWRRSPAMVPTRDQ
jgi:hypothetical protein